MDSSASTQPLPAANRRTNAGRHRHRWLPWLGAVLLLALIIAGLWPQPAPVETARVVQGTLRATISEEGKTRIKQRYLVSAPVAGQLRRITFKAGAEVQAGQTSVAVIDPLSPALLDARSRTSAEARRDAAVAHLERARMAHTFAVSELKRFERLYGEKTVTIQEFETVQWREASTAREKAAAESALRQAEAELAEFTPPPEGGANALRAPVEVKAPSSGRVLRVFEESSRVVAAGTPLLEVGDPTDLEVVIEVLSRDGAALAPGAAVELEQWGGAEPLRAVVRLVEPAAFTKVSALGVEEQRVNVIADFVTPPAQRKSLGDAFRVDARIVAWETSAALKVPAGALFRRGEEWAAFVLAEGRAQLRLVKVGQSSGVETQVLEGLAEGDEVILYPGDRVRDGLRVRRIRV
jgi:HlyD family secretion protein